MTTHSVRTWLETEALRLRTLDPEAPLDDLERLADIVGDARVVGIGESAHLVHEFYRARHRLLRFLVERLGFHAFIMESGWCVGVAVTEWVRGGEGDLAELQKTGFTYGMGSCNEMADQINWMRGYNQSGRGHVDFFGMDMIASLSTPEPGLGPIFDYLDCVEPRAADYFRMGVMPIVERFASETQEIGRYEGLSDMDRDRLTVLLTDLELLFDDRRIDYIGGTSDKEYSFARQHVALVKQFDDLIRHFPATEEKGPLHPFADGRMRDRYMAENVGWVLDQLGPRSRVVVAAHNGHLQREPLRANVEGKEIVAVPNTLGQYLNSTWGDSFRPIALTHRTGQVLGPSPVTLEDPNESSIDAVVSSSGIDPLLVDLRKWPVEDAVGQALDKATTMRLNNMYVHIDPRRAFDAILHIDTTRPVAGM